MKKRKVVFSPEEMEMMLPFESMHCYWRMQVRKRFWWIFAVMAVLTLLVGTVMANEADMGMELLEQILEMDEELSEGLFPKEVVFDGPDVKAHAPDFGWKSGSFMDTLKIDSVMLFRHNTQACLMGILSGILPFLFLPMVGVVINGAVLGLAGGASAGMMGLTAALSGLVPHGIFEVPAMILSYALGLALCRTLTKAILKRPHLPLGWVVKQTVLIFVTIVLPLLAVAAYIEGEITPELMLQSMGEELLGEMFP